MPTIPTTYPTLLTRTAWWSAIEAHRAQRYQRLGRSYRLSAPPAPAPRVPPFAIGLTANDGYVSVPPAWRTTLTHLLAIPNAGKTTLLENLALADIKAGMGLVFLDPHADVIDHLLWRIVEEVPERIPDVVLLDPRDVAYPFSLPLYRTVDPADQLAFQRAVDQSVHVFQAQWGLEGSRGMSWGPHLEDLATVVGHTLVEAGGTLRDVVDLLTVRAARDRILARVRNPAIRQFWATDYPGEATAREREEQRQFRSSFINKVRALTLNRTVANITSQPARAVDFARCIAERAIVLVPLAAPIIGDPAASLLGSIMIGDVLAAGFARAALPPDRRHLVMLYLDEVQLMQTPDLHQLATQIRKFGIGVVQGHQFLGQLSEKNRDAALLAANFIAGQLSVSDTELVARKFDNTPVPGPLEYKPVMLPSTSGLFEPLKAGYGTDTLVQYQQVAGPELSTDELRARKANTLGQLPLFRFLARLRQGNTFAEYSFQAFPSPCFGRELPAWVAERIAAIRQRSRERYGTPRERGAADVVKEQGNLPGASPGESAAASRTRNGRQASAVDAEIGRYTGDTAANTLIATRQRL